MKVKLLKKLRKLAHNKIYVIYNPYRVTGYCYTIYKKRFINKYEYLTDFKNYEAAIKYCDIARKDYIKLLIRKRFNNKIKRVY